MTKADNAPTITRRAFLRNSAIIATGTLFAACALEQEEVGGVDPFESAYSVPELPTSQAATTSQEEPPELAGFLALSALLTGVDELDPAFGRIYLQSLQENSELPMTVAQLLEHAQTEQSALPTSLEELERRGIFEDESTRALTDKLMEYWYTGIYETANGEQVVATFVDALAWKTLTFTKPMTICGSYRFWTEPPETAID